MSEDIEDDGFITVYPTKTTRFANVRFDSTYFDETYEYKGFALVNELYEDEDCRKNYYQWGRLVDGYVINIKELEGLSSRSYAGWDEVWSLFTWTVEDILKKMQNNG